MHWSAFHVIDKQCSFISQNILNGNFFHSLKLKLYFLNNFFKQIYCTYIAILAKCLVNIKLFKILKVVYQHLFKKMLLVKQKLTLCYLHEIGILFLFALLIPY